MITIAIQAATGQTVKIAEKTLLLRSLRIKTLTFLTQSSAVQVLLYFLQFQNHCFDQVLQGVALLYQVLPKERKQRMYLNNFLLVKHHSKKVKTNLPATVLAFSVLVFQIYIHHIFQRDQKTFKRIVIKKHN